MARLAQLSSIDSDRGRALLALLLQHSPVLRALDESSAFEELGTDFQYFLLNGALTLQRRALAGSYTAADTTPGSAQTGSLAFVGFSVDVDRSHREDERRGLLDIDRWVDKELAKKIRTFARAVEVDIFNGSGAGSPRQPKGLIEIMDGTTDVPGFTGDKMTIDAVDYDTGDSFDLGDTSHYDIFLEAFELWMHEVSATHIFANYQMAARLTTIARTKHILGEQRDAFGMPQQTIHGVPIVRVRPAVIANDEPDNAGSPATNTTSLYLASPGEMKWSIATNSGFQYDDLGTLEGKESERAKGEMRLDNLIQDDESILRVRNIKL